MIEYYYTKSLATAAAAIEQGFEGCLSCHYDNTGLNWSCYAGFMVIAWHDRGQTITDWRFPKTPHNVALMEVQHGDLATLNGKYIALGEDPIKSAIIIFRNNKPFRVWD